MYQQSAPCLYYVFFTTRSILEFIFTIPFSVNLRELRDFSSQFSLSVWDWKMHIKCQSKTTSSMYKVCFTCNVPKYLCTVKFLVEYKFLSSSEYPGHRKWGRFFVKILPKQLMETFALNYFGRTKHGHSASSVFCFVPHLTGSLRFIDSCCYSWHLFYSLFQDIKQTGGYDNVNIYGILN